MHLTDKVLFFCRDGCIYGNPIILVNYSRLLAEALNACSGKPAIKLPDTSIRDVKCLFHVLNSLTFAEVSNPLLTGLQNVARLLDVDLTLQNGRNGFIRVMASPLPLHKEEFVTSTPLNSASNIDTNFLPSKVQINPNDSSSLLAGQEHALDTSKEKSFSIDTLDCVTSHKIGPLETTHERPQKELNPPQVPSEIESVSNNSTSQNNGKPSASVNGNRIDHEERSLDADIDEDKGLSMDTSFDDSTQNTPNPGPNEYQDLKQLRISTKKYYTKTNRKEEYTCNICKFIAKNWFEIKTHIETEHLLLEFECKKCGYLSFWRPEMMKHLRNVHKSRSATENLYVTRQGERMNDLEDALPEDPKIEEIQEAEEFSLKTEESFQKKIEHTNQSLDEVEEKKILSPVKPFERLSSRIPDINKDCYQILKVGNKKVYKCLSCAKECKTYCGIREHQYSAHYGYVCICNHCDVKYRSRSNMFKHLSVAHQVMRSFTMHFGYYIEEGHQKSPDTSLETADSESNGSYKCKICSTTYSDRNATINHLIYKHRIKSDVSPFYEEISESVS